MGFILILDCGIGVLLVSYFSNFFGDLCFVVFDSVRVVVEIGGWCIGCFGLNGIVFVVVCCVVCRLCLGF